MAFSPDFFEPRRAGLHFVRAASPGWASGGVGVAGRWLGLWGGGCLVGLAGRCGRGVGWLGSARFLPALWARYLPPARLVFIEADACVFTLFCIVGTL